MVIVFNQRKDGRCGTAHFKFGHVVVRSPKILAVMQGFGEVTLQSELIMDQKYEKRIKTTKLLFPLLF
jgi:hypothetical protein